MDENQSKPKLLIVEDDDLVIRMYKRSLGEDYALVIADTLKSAKWEFLDGKDFALVVLDGEMIERDPHNGHSWIGYTFSLLEIILRRFKGPIIAAPGDPEIQRRLLANGCTHAAEKNDLGKVVRQLLG